MAKPTVSAVTKTSIKLNWSPPQDDGGCLLKGYAVFVDDGNEGNFVEANSDVDTNVRLNPNLNELVVTRGLSGNEGKTFRLKVLAYNPLDEYI